MKLSSAAILLASLYTTHSVVGFAPTNVSTRYSDPTTVRHMSAVNDAQELLRKARALRQEAEADEHTLHTSLIGKKQSIAQDTDKTIEEIFPANLPKGKAGVWKVAEILETKRFSAPCLERVVERLHEREIAAKGISHVEPSLHHTHVKFEKVAASNEVEMERIEGLIKLLIDAAQVLDEKVMKGHREKGTASHHVDSTHWCSGELSDKLEEKASFLGREHDEQFKRRSEEYYEAARKKKHISSNSGDSTTRLS